MGMRFAQACHRERGFALAHPGARANGSGTVFDFGFSSARRNTRSNVARGNPRNENSLKRVTESSGPAQSAPATDALAAGATKAAPRRRKPQRARRIGSAKGERQGSTTDHHG